MIDTRPVLQNLGVKPKGFALIPVGTPWTEREIEKGMAFRSRSNGELIKIEICHGCRQGFTPGEGKLGYASGYGLCFNCTQIGVAAQKTELIDRILNVLKPGPLSVTSLAHMLGEPFGVIENTLRIGSINDKVVRDGKRWAAKA